MLQDIWVLYNDEGNTVIMTFKTEEAMDTYAQTVLGCDLSYKAVDAGDDPNYKSVMYHAPSDVDDDMSIYSAHTVKLVG